MLDQIVFGFSVSLAPYNLLLCAAGVVIGTLVGVLPGIGPGAAIALLLPVTFGLNPTAAVILLAGIFCGCQYGGSTTSILLNIPGEAASAVTAIDGHKMAKAGRAGPALGIAAFGSFIGGTLSVAGLMLVADPLASLALKFGPPEYFAFVCLGMTLIVFLAQNSIQKALVAGLIGIILSQIGTDPIASGRRFTFGFPELTEGIAIVPLMLGLFGLAEVLISLDKGLAKFNVITHVKNLFPNLQDWKDSATPIARGSLLGFVVGILPGGGPSLASFISYGVEKKFAKEPGRFGHGAIQGVAGPESANNAATGGSFVPLLSLGIPTNVIMALLFSALMVHGVTPGPLLIKQHPDVFWGLITSMYVANVLLLVLNLPLIAIWVQILKIPYRILFPAIVLFCVVGSYNERGLAFDVVLMMIFGAIGFAMRKFDFDVAPLVIGFILGDLLEENLRNSLLLSDGSFLIFVQRPISLFFLVLTLTVLAWNAWHSKASRSR